MLNGNILYQYNIMTIAMASLSRRNYNKLSTFMLRLGGFIRKTSFNVVLVSLGFFQNVIRSFKLIVGRLKKYTFIHNSWRRIRFLSGPMKHFMRKIWELVIVFVSTMSGKLCSMVFWLQLTNLLIRLDQISFYQLIACLLIS